MSTLYFGMLSEDAPPQDVEKVTRNTPPVQVDGPAKELGHAPDFNEFNSDPDPELGYTSHQLASDWHQPEKYSPGMFGDLATLEHDDIVNRDIAKVGTAAAREQAGEYGYGTGAYAVGVEPVIRKGAAFGTDYFAAHERSANETTDYATGVQPVSSVDNADNSRASADGKAMARYAFQDTTTADIYAAYLGG